jgi:hypothetical protein
MAPTARMSCHVPAIQAIAIAPTDQAAIHREAKKAHVTPTPQMGPSTQLRGEAACPAGNVRLTMTAHATATATSASTHRVVTSFLRSAAVNRTAVHTVASR